MRWITNNNKNTKNYRDCRCVLLSNKCIILMWLNCIWQLDIG